MESSDQINNTGLNALKELILDDNFTELKSLANEEVNLMSILRVSHKELQHSNFLSCSLTQMPLMG